MAAGDQNDMAGRWKSVLPNGWFPDTSPVLDGVAAGVGACFAWLYALIAYVNLQGRITTATGVFLDIIGLDFLGTRVFRKSGQSDASWRGRIQDEILAPRATRPAMISRLTKLTGRAPVIFEPAMPMDTGGLNVGSLALGVAGGLGNINLPFQCFVTAFRPHIGGISGYAGLGYAGLDISGLASHDMIEGQVTDDDINAAIVACAADATIPWTRILS